MAQSRTTAMAEVGSWRSSPHGFIRAGVGRQKRFGSVTQSKIDLVNPSRRKTHRQLDRLGQVERAVSARRRQLHHDIDQLYLAAPHDENQMQELDRLEMIEQAVSRQRRRLHEMIDELRAQIGLPPLARRARARQRRLTGIGSRR